MAYTNPTTMVAGQVFTASRWNTQVKDNFDMLASLANDGTLKWDNTNKRLGVGTTTPAAKLHVRDSTGGRLEIKFENAHGTSKSVQFNFGGASTGGVSNWSFGNDLSLNGTKDLYFFDNAGSATRLYISATGSLLVGKTSGLTGAGDIDAAGTVKGNVLQTGTTTWALGTFSFGAVAQTGYVTVTINGSNYRLLVG